MLGFDTFAQFPFATVAPDTGVIINASGNQLNITIGRVGIIASSIIEDVTENQLALGLGTLSITGNASFNVTGSQVSLGLGNFVITADSNVNVTGNTLTIATGNVTVTGTAVVNPDGSSLSLDSKEPGVITWNDIIPGATMVWTPIKPY